MHEPCAGVGGEMANWEDYKSNEADFILFLKKYLGLGILL